MTTPTSTTTEQLQDRPASGERTLLVVDGAPFQVVPLPQKGTLSIGRSSRCDVAVDSASVSRHHANLIVADFLEVEDVGSSNGTFLGATQIPAQHRRRIGLGMPFHIGGVTMLIQIRPRANAVKSGSTGALARLEAAAARLNTSNLGVLITGESGVGKGYFAERVHELSSRSHGPFVRLNCDALTPSQVELDMFGSEAGPGLFERADGGTVFLDNITELPAALQLKLLRVIESATSRRFGPFTPRRVDVRYIAATAKDLAVECEQRRFRDDLYFRIAGVTFTIQPLRERTDELIPMAERFVAEAAGPLGRARMLGDDAKLWITEHTWPGNVRELRNACERAVLLSTGSLIERRHFSVETCWQQPAPQPVPKGSQPGSLRVSIAELERRRILEALEQCGGNQTRAAAALGIARRTLINRLDEFGIARPRKS